MTDTRVRPAVPDDVPAIERVARDSWHAAYDEVLGPDAVEEVLDDWYDPGGLRDAVTNGEHVFVVAERSGTVAGFAHAGPHPERGSWVLYRIYVDPECWDEGVGSALLERIETELADCGVSTYELAVLADNDVGVSFYEARGFERVETETVVIAGVQATEYRYRKDL